MTRNHPHNPEENPILQGAWRAFVHSELPQVRVAGHIVLTIVTPTTSDYFCFKARVAGTYGSGVSFGSSKATKPSINFFGTPGTSYTFKASYNSTSTTCGSSCGTATSAVVARSTQTITWTAPGRPDLGLERRGRLLARQRE